MASVVLQAKMLFGVISKKVSHEDFFKGGGMFW